MNMKHNYKVCFSAVELSKFIVNNCIDVEHPINNLQLQVILYYVQKAFLDKSMMAFDDKIEAWQFGPVVPAVYYHFCHFAAMPISIRESEVSISRENSSIILPIIKRMRVLHPWDSYREIDKPGGAWDIVYNNGQGLKQAIPISLLCSETLNTNVQRVFSKIGDEDHS